ncbi:MAG: fumarylacetoacetate hydrolase family protein [Acidobacteria bacterium]|nr:fumarylacetoacetate hydrolase family protein [Acidobacteriota bacterium]
MKYVRYQYRDIASYGVLEGGTIRDIGGGLFGNRKETGKVRDLRDVKLLCPCEPSKVLAIGLNYRSHLGDRVAPDKPAVFVVPPSALLEPEGEIRIPPDAEDTHYEGELVAVIGTTTRDATPAEAEESIFGFTCGNDISERKWQKNDLQWWRAKGCDTFAPLGPCIETAYNWRGRGIKTRLNGTVVQQGRFAELLFDPPAIVSHISRYITLQPGDVVYTGTPGNTAALRHGDTVTVEIEGIGVLTNTVRNPGRRV